MSALDTAAAFVEALPGERRILVGIAGPPGVGKSTLAAALAARLGATALVVPMDGFHLPQARLVELGRRERMGAPDTFDVEGFTALRKPGEVRAPLFDRVTEEAVPDALPIGAGHRILLVEGNYLLHDRDGWERIAPLLDAGIFLRLDDEVRRERLIARHAAYGKTPDEARAWVLRWDERNAELVADGAARADLVLDLD